MLTHEQQGLGAKMETRNSSLIPFINQYPLEEILGSRLPTQGDVFRYFYFLRHEKGLPPAEAQKKAVQSASVFWQEAGISIKKIEHGISSLAKILVEFQVSFFH